MPLYMDIHTVDSDDFSVEDVVKAHMEDLDIQEQFGVTQLKYWVNEPAKTLFCLMEGPNKEACHEVHVQSHGNTACNIIEVSDNEYNLFMGVGTHVNDLAHTQKGELDTGYRTILLTNLVCFTENADWYSKEIHNLIDRFNGVVILEPSNQLMASFIYAKDAIACATSIKTLLQSTDENVEFSLAVVSGRPVDEEGEKLFEDSKRKVQGLCSLGLTGRVYIDQESQILAVKEDEAQKQMENIVVIYEEDMKFSQQLSDLLPENLTKGDFKSEDIFTSLGISKSQAYRKVKSLTGMAPNQLIQESRLQKALLKLSNPSESIAEVAYETGFNSPTYFTRVFKKRFGVLPSDYLR